MLGITPHDVLYHRRRLDVGYFFKFATGRFVGASTEQIGAIFEGLLVIL